MQNILKRKIALIVSMDSKQVGKHSQLIERRMQSIKRAAKSAFKVIAVGAVAAVGAMGFLGKGVFDTGIMFDKFKIQLKVLFGSMEAGQKKFEWIKKFAVSTPYELEQVVDAFVKLKATGLDAAKNNLLKDLGDLASAAQKPLEQVVMAVSNIASGMTGIGMKQLMLLNINRDMLAQEGIVFTKMGALNKKYSSSMDMIAALQRIIQKRFSGMMVEQSKTLGGVITNIKDAWTQIKAVIAEKIFPIVKPDLEKIRDLLFDALNSGRAKRWAEQIKRSFSKFYTWAKDNVPKMWNVVKTIVGQIVDIASPIWNAMKNNPSMVKTAVIVLVMTKTLAIAKEIATVMKTIGILSLVKGMAKLKAVSAAIASITSGGLVTTIGGGALGAGAIVGGGALAYDWWLDDLKKQRQKKGLYWYGRKLSKDEAEFALQFRQDMQKAEGAPGSKIYTKPQQKPVVMSLGKIKDNDVENWEETLAGNREKYNQQRIQDAEKTKNYLIKLEENYVDRLLEDETGLKQRLLDLERDFRKGKIGVIDFVNASQREKEVTTQIETKKQKLRLEELIWDAKLALVSEKEAEKLNLEKEYADKVQEIKNMEYLSEEELQMALFTLKLDYSQKFIDIDNKYLKNRQKTNKELLKVEKAKYIAETKYIQFQQKFETEYVGRKMAMEKAAAAASISLVADTVAEELRIQGKKWAIEAAASIWSNPAKAAGLFAAATAAGVAAGLVTEMGRSLSERITSSNDEGYSDELPVGDVESGYGSRTQSAYSTRGVQNLYISPTVTFIGDTQIIGDTGLEEAGETISDIAVKAIRDAIETGELSIE